MNKKQIARIVEMGMPEELEQGVKEVLFWQTWQLHAKLRQRFMQSDPQAVRMIDSLVGAFYAARWAGAGGSMASVMEEIVGAHEAIGEALPDAEAYAIMRLQPVG